MILRNNCNGTTVDAIGWLIMDDLSVCTSRIVLDEQWEG